VLRIVLLVHLLAVIVSPLLFTVRARRAWLGHDPAQGLLRWLPHAVDTVLLGAGLSLAVMTGQNPLVQSWLTAKLLALVCYVLAGHIAVRRARRRRWILAAWLLALAIFAYICAVAFTMRPVPWA
jgi:uncharacterized membrane protein SirB2